MKELKKDLISVIVPCYNVEVFLQDCFSSIRAQTYKNFEVIFVDDGSSDGTLKMLQDFCSGNLNCRVISKENGGVSSARNTAIENAAGEFIYFLDPDDFFDPRTLEVAHNVLKNSDADLCIFKNKWLRESPKLSYESVKKISARKIRKIKLKYIVGTDNLLSLYFARRLNLAIWNKLYRHEILRKVPTYPKVFRENVYLGSDVEFSYNYLKLSKKAVCFPLRLYCYRQRKNSIQRSKYTEKKYSVFESFERMENLDEAQFPTALTYIRSLKTSIAYETLRRTAQNGDVSIEKIEKAYRDFKAGLKDVRKGRKNPFYIKLAPCSLPFVWHYRNKAVKREKKKRENEA